MHKIRLIVVSISLLLTAISGHTAIAEEWVASKLRGAVFVYDGAEWQQIFRGYTVESSRAIQTAPNARVVFSRGKESIDVGGDTRIRIEDRVGKLNTIIEQDFGQITIDVEKRNVQHFAVQAPLLTAVVKGTKFTVSAPKGAGFAKVKVRRGLVEVQDRERRVKINVKPGQEANRSEGNDQVVEVDGTGDPEPYFDMSTNAAVANTPDELKTNLVKEGKMAKSAMPAQSEAAEASTKAQANVEALEQQLAAVQSSGSGLTEKEQQKAVEKLEKAIKKEAEDAAKAAKKASEEAEKAAKEAAKEAEKAAKDAAKADEEEDKKAAEKAAKEASEKAKQAAKEAEKAAEKAEKAKKDAAKEAAEKAEKAKKDAAKEAAEKAAQEAKEKAEQDKKDKDGKKDKDDKKGGGVTDLVKDVVGGLGL